MSFHRFPLNSIDFLWITWISIGFHWFPLDSIHFHRIPRISIGFLWISTVSRISIWFSLDFLWIPKISIGLHGFPPDSWIFLEFHGFPSDPMDFHRISMEFHENHCPHRRVLVLRTGTPITRRSASKRVPLKMSWRSKRKHLNCSQANAMFHKRMP